MALGLTGLTQLMSGAGSDEDIWGKKPKVPEFPSYTDALKEIIQGNISALPSLRRLGLESTEAYSKMMEKAYPGIGELKNLGTSTIKSFLSGELPQSVQDQLKLQSAEYGVGSGTGGSGFAGARGLRNLGIEQLRYVQTGLDSASRWIGQAQGQTFDFTKMFLGPQDAIRQAENRFSRNWLANQIAAAPEPAARGAFDTEMQWIGMILSAYSGGSGYKPQPTGTPGLTSYPYTGQMNMGTSYFNPVSNYGYGPTPTNTSYNPMTDQSTYDPYAGMGSLGGLSF